jgi:endonuclease-3
MMLPSSEPGGLPVSLMLQRIAQACEAWPAPAIDALPGATPFRVLIATLLSLRTRDTVTAPVAARLFARADTPAALLACSVEELAALIRPVGFYRTKARQIHAICHILLEQHGGAVPASLDGLLALPGVGRKTANLTLTAGFGLPGICVDVHVHRICNRWGYVTTSDPDATELALRRILPERHWAEINRLLVAFGQNLCGPRRPHCERCPVAEWCARRGVAPPARR